MMSAMTSSRRSQHRRGLQGRALRLRPRALRPRAPQPAPLAQPRHRQRAKLGRTRPPRESRSGPSRAPPRPPPRAPAARSAARRRPRARLPNAGSRSGKVAPGYRCTPGTHARPAVSRLRRRRLALGRARAWALAPRPSRRAPPARRESSPDFRWARAVVVRRWPARAARAPCRGRSCVHRVHRLQHRRRLRSAPPTSGS